MARDASVETLPQSRRGWYLVSYVPSRLGRKSLRVTARTHGRLRSVTTALALAQPL